MNVIGHIYGLSAVWLALKHSSSGQHIYSVHMCLCVSGKAFNLHNYYGFFKKDTRKQIWVVSISLLLMCSMFLMVEIGDDTVNNITFAELAPK